MRHQKINKFFLLVFALFLVYFKSSCSLIKSTIGMVYQKPKVQIANIKVKKISLNEVDFELNIDINNPNRHTLEFDYLEYNVKIGKNTLAEGQHKSNMKFSSHSTSRVSLPLSINTSNTIHAIKNMLLNKKNIEIECSGKAVLLSSFKK